MNLRIDRLIQALLAKSQHCEHGCSCFEHVSIQGFETFKYAYILRTALSLFQILVKFKKSKLKQILKILISKDNIKFCLFLSSYTLITKGLHCLLRNKYEQDSPKYAFYCGFLGGMISLSFLKSEQRKFWALYMIVRALDTRFHKLQKYLLISQLKQYAYVIIYSFMQLIAAYAYFFEEDTFGEKQTRVWEKFQNLSLRESQLRALTNLSVYAR